MQLMFCFDCQFISEPNLNLNIFPVIVLNSFSEVNLKY